MTITVQHNNYAYTLARKENPLAGKSGLIQLKDYLGTSKGAHKFTDLPSKICKFSAEAARLTNNPGLSLAIQRPGAVFNRLSGGFIYAYCAFAAFALKESVDNVAKEGSARNIENLVKDAFTSVNAACHTTLLFIPGFSALSSVASVADLASDGIELKQEACGWNNAANAEQIDTLSPEVRDLVVQKKKSHMYGVLKSVVSVAAGIITVLGLILATTIAPKIVMAALGLTAIALTFIHHFHKVNMAEEFKISRVFTPLIAG